MNWTYTVTTNGMAGFIGAVYLGVVAIRTRRALYQALHALRRFALAGRSNHRRDHP